VMASATSEKSSNADCRPPDVHIFYNVTG
jgi:hypothetical protein